MELNTFKYPQLLRGIIIIITVPKANEYQEQWAISENIRLRSHKEYAKDVLSRLWIPLKNLDKSQTIILDSLANFNRFYGAQFNLQDLQLEIEPIYTNGELIINGTIHKMLDGKLYKRIRKRKTAT